MNLSTADLRNYRTEFHETWWSYRYMLLQLEVININVRNFKFPIVTPTPFEPPKIWLWPPLPQIWKL
jgi:hypothetical protein